MPARSEAPPANPENGNPSPRTLSSIRRLRWALLDAIDGLRAVPGQTGELPFFVRGLLRLGLWIGRLGLAIILQVLSAPVYLSGTPQKSFSLYARRRGDRYIDSYTSYLRGVQFWVGVCLVTIIAVTLGLVAAINVSSQRNRSESPYQRTRTIGVLTRTRTLDSILDAFTSELAERGYRVNENLSIERRYSGTDDAELDEHAKAFLRSGNDLVLALGDPAALAMQRIDAEGAIPTLFFTAGDPVELGLIDSFASSGNNLAGIGSVALLDRQFGLLRRIKPDADALGVLLVGDDIVGKTYIAGLEKIAPTLGLRPEKMALSRVEDIAAVFEAFASKDVSSVYIAPGAVASTMAKPIAEEALRRGIILFGNTQHYAEAGALFSLYIDQERVGRKLAAKADAIFRGTRPTDISSDLPDRSFLYLNTSTAAVLGLTIPQDVLDEVDATY
ncbi:MAG: ABC transporter substrate-binding protein [Candidatus Kerfeldbacteria bacterium]|nr:ABC transporter substrate-binding protein [Candidatus Kerfeldbacteria bacterium]